MQEDSLSHSIAKLFEEACATDMEALKPGNVGLHRAGHGMCRRDFAASAAASAAPLCRSRAALGERIVAAVEATRRVVSQNTNLGIVLLCAPLAHAALHRRPAQSLRDAVAEVLGATTVEDARRAYRAIGAARAGGLGRVARHDVAHTPRVNLREAMRAACRRDRIAAQYINDYREVFDYGVPLLLEFRSKWGNNSWSAVGVYLTLLAEYPDSLVARKHGAQQAALISRKVAPLQSRLARGEKPEKFRQRLLDLDADLKQRGINPGTTADLTVASIFGADLERMISTQ